MQQQVLGYKQKLADEVIVSNRFTPTNPVNNHESAITKASPSWRRAIKFDRLNSHTDSVRREALSRIPIRNAKDILEIRSIGRHNKVSAHLTDESPLITINVSGDHFQTHLSTLELYPNTLLGNNEKRKLFWNAQTEEYFFDRHRACFEAILYYYQSHGRIRRPEFVPLDTFLEEIAFFELGVEALNQVRQMENVKVINERPMPRKVWRWYLWYYFEYPQYSNLARVINIISILFTILSCVALAVESLPDYANHWEDICKLQANVSLNATYVPLCAALFYSPFFIIQTICVVYFTLEFLLRVISTPSYFRFVLSFSNWVDLSSIVPYYVFLSIQLADQQINLNTNAIIFVRILRILRFSRIVKIYLVFQQLKSLRVLSATIKESLIDFLVLITMLTLLAFLFGAATYLAEQQANGVMFDSIPRATYWGIITVTGVGYGDMYPVTAVGRLLTCLFALLGSSTMGMLTSVLVDRYQRVFNRKMYISEPDVLLAEADNKSDNDDDESKVNTSSVKLHRRLRITSFQQKRKIDRSHKVKLQFLVSFNDDNKDYHSSDQIITMMKRKLTEAISTTNIDVNLKLIDNNDQELWTISSSDIFQRIDSETMHQEIDSIEEEQDMRNSP